MLEPTLWFTLGLGGTRWIRQRVFRELLYLWKHVILLLRFDALILKKIGYTKEITLLLMIHHVKSSPSFFFLRQKADRPAPMHKVQLTIWQVFHQVERRFPNQELNRQPLLWDLGISPPSSGSLGSSRSNCKNILNNPCGVVRPNIVTFNYEDNDFLSMSWGHFYRGWKSMEYMFRLYRWKVVLKNHVASKVSLNTTDLFIEIICPRQDWLWIYRLFKH